MRVLSPKKHGDAALATTKHLGNTPLRYDPHFLSPDGRAIPRLDSIFFWRRQSLDVAERFLATAGSGLSTVPGQLDQQQSRILEKVAEFF
jgi:hypothetical protein